MSEKVGVEKKGLTQQQRIDRLRDWLNRTLRIGPPPKWNPFVSLDDARVLLEKCERQRLEQEYLNALIGRIVAGCLSQSASMKPFGWLIEMATAKQQTEAIEAVAFPEKNNG